MELRDYLFGGVTRVSAYKGLDAAATRGRAIAQNLANVNTPDYRRKEVSFEEELRRVMELKLPGTRTQEKHMPITQEKLIEDIKPDIYEAKDPTLPGQINNVDVDLEASKMAENQIMYRYLLKFVGFGNYQTAISGNPGG